MWTVNSNRRVAFVHQTNHMPFVMEKAAAGVWNDVLIIVDGSDNDGRYFLS